MNPPDDYAYTLQLIGASEVLKLAEKWLRTHSIAGDDEPIIPGFFSETEDIEKNGLIVGRAFTLEWGSISEEPELKQTIDQLATAFPQMQIDLVEENVDHAEKTLLNEWADDLWEAEKKSAEYFRSDDLGFIVDLEKARQQGLLQKRELAPERMTDQLAAAQEQAKATINTPRETVERDTR